MVTYGVTIDGNVRQFRNQSMSFAATANGVDTLQAEIVSLDGAYIPAIDDPVVVEEDGTRIFGGLITSVVVVGLGGKGVRPVVSRISVEDFNGLAQRRFVVDTVPAGSVKSQLTFLAPYYEDYGVVLDAGQDDGPDVPAIEGAYRRFDAVLADIATNAKAVTSTEWLWEIDYDLNLSIFEPGGEAAPFDIEDGDNNTCGDIEVEYTKATGATKVIVRYGEGQVERTDVFTADGIVDVFTLKSPVTTPILGVVDRFDGAIHHYETVSYAGEGGMWEVDNGANTITRVLGAPDNGDTITYRYMAQFPATVSATAPGVDPEDVVEMIILRPDIFETARAQALADGLIVTRGAMPRKVTYSTYTLGLESGMTQHMAIAWRGLDDDVLVSEIRGVTIGNRVKRTVICDVSQQFTGTFRDVYTAWNGGGGTTAASPSVSGGGAASIGFAATFPLGGSLNASAVTVGSEIRPIARDEPEIPWASLGSGLVAKARVFVQTSAGTVTPEIVDDLTNVYSNGSTTSATPVLKEITIPATTADRTYYLRFAVSGGASAGSIRGGGHIQLKRAA